MNGKKCCSHLSLPFSMSFHCTIHGPLATTGTGLFLLMSTCLFKVDNISSPLVRLSSDLSRLLPVRTMVGHGHLILRLLLIALVPAVSLPLDPAAEGPFLFVGLRGGSADRCSSEDNNALPARLRSTLLATAETTYLHETALQPRDGMSHMTISQHLVYERSFANARSQGVSVPEAQELAIRSVAEGRIVEPDASMTGKKKIMCLACQYEIPDRALLRSHFSTDWHALNLERRRSGLPPLAQTDVEERARALLVEEQQRENEEEEFVVQQNARRVLSKASRRSAKLAADIEKLLATNEAKDGDKAVLAKVRMLLDKKAVCDKVMGNTA